jgi:hypothetical protein
MIKPINTLQAQRRLSLPSPPLVGNAFLDREASRAIRITRPKSAHSANAVAVEYRDTDDSFEANHDKQ